MHWHKMHQNAGGLPPEETTYTQEKRGLAMRLAHLEWQKSHSMLRRDDAVPLDALSNPQLRRSANMPNDMIAPNI